MNMWKLVVHRYTDTREIVEEPLFFRETTTKGSPYWLKQYCAQHGYGMDVTIKATMTEGGLMALCPNRVVVLISPMEVEPIKVEPPHGVDAQQWHDYFLEDDYSHHRIDAVYFGNRFGALLDRVITPTELLDAIADLPDSAYSKRYVCYDEEFLEFAELCEEGVADYLAAGRVYSPFTGHLVPRDRVVTSYVRGRK